MIIYLVLAFIPFYYYLTSPFTVFSNFWEMIKSTTLRKTHNNRSVKKKASIAQPAEEEKKTDLEKLS